MNKIFVNGEDERSIFLKEMLQKEGKYTNLENAEYVYFSIPFRKYNNLEEIKNLNKKIIIGGASKEQKEFLDNNNVEYIDLMKNEKFVYNNAVLTAESTIPFILSTKKSSIQNLNILVMGYGRIGSNLSEILNKLGANLFCFAIRKESIAKIIKLGYNYIELESIANNLEKIDIIINTIPRNILSYEMLSKIKEYHIPVLELASSPYGMDISIADKLEVDYKILSALPARIVPKSAALFVKETIYEEIMKGREK